jgi:hypothetical protein
MNPQNLAASTDPRLSHTASAGRRRGQALDW